MTTTNTHPLTDEELERLDALVMRIGYIQRNVLTDVHSLDLLSYAESLLFAVGGVGATTALEDARLTAANDFHSLGNGKDAFAAIANLAELEVLLEHPEVLIEAARQIQSRLRAVLYADMPEQPHAA